MRYSNLMADLSSNNVEFQANLYADTGHVAVAIKATEGTGYIDPDYRPWCFAAGGKRLAVIHYHFARPDLGTSPSEEAAFFMRVATPLLGPRDYVCLDLERATPEGYSHDPAWSREFDDYVQHHSRYHTILYANASTLRVSNNWLVGDKRRAWVADWSSGPDYAPDGYQVALRQFTDGVFGPDPHQLPGVGQCDVSIMRPAFFRGVLASRAA